jgi:peptide/nickel transport system permease protein
VTAALADVSRRAGRSGHALWRTRNGRLGLCGTGITALMALAGLAGILPHNPIAQHPAARFTGPSRSYWLGTDQFGRDVASRIAVGIWNSLRVAGTSVALAVVVGLILGMAAGYFGGWADQVIGRFVDVLFAFPAILLALALVTALGTAWWNTAIAIAVVYTPIFTRVVRGSTLVVSTSEYVKAARVLGIRTHRILLRHVMPNVSAPVVAQVTLALSWAILTESSLSFLGLGTQPPEPSLGLMVSDAINNVSQAWWTLAFPAAAIVFAVVSLNLLGDGLRSVLDPRGESPS